MNSQQSINTFDCANCIGLSLFLKKYLKKHYNIVSFLIPASIPNKYKYPGYLDISHVVLCIPLDKYRYYNINVFILYIIKLIHYINLLIPKILLINNKIIIIIIKSIKSIKINLMLQRYNR